VYVCSSYALCHCFACFALINLDIVVYYLLTWHTCSVVRILFDLLQMNVAPMAIERMLRSMAASSASASSSAGGTHRHFNSNSASTTCDIRSPAGSDLPLTMTPSSTQLSTSESNGKWKWKWKWRDCDYRSESFRLWCLSINYRSIVVRQTNQLSNELLSLECYVLLSQCVDTVSEHWHGTVDVLMQFAIDV